MCAAVAVQARPKNSGSTLHDRCPPCSTKRVHTLQIRRFGASGAASCTAAISVEAPTHAAVPREGSPAAPGASPLRPCTMLGTAWAADGHSGGAVATWGRERSGAVRPGDWRWRPRHEGVSAGVSGGDRGPRAEGCRATNAGPCSRPAPFWQQGGSIQTLYSIQVCTCCGNLSITHGARRAHTAHAAGTRGGRKHA